MSFCMNSFSPRCRDFPKRALTPTHPDTPLAGLLGQRTMQGHITGGGGQIQRWLQ